MKRILAALLLLTFAAPASGQDHEKGLEAYDQRDNATLIGRAMIVLFKDTVSSDDRKIVAKGFEDFCRELSGKIPALSPRENDWVDAEISARRIETLYSSVEFSKRQSKRTLSGCHRRAQSLAQVLPEDREIALWSMLLGEILDEHLLAHIRNLKESGAAKISDQDKLSVSLFPMLAHFIVNKILTPSLIGAAQTK